MLEVQWFGKRPYNESCRIQHSGLQEIRYGATPKVMGFEYPTTITQGIRSQGFLDILKPRDFWESQKIPIVSTGRGGQTTLHSPGQLVIYPLLPLSSWRLGVKDYVHLLLKATSQWLLHQGVWACERKNHTGLFTERGKIAFVGIAVRYGVSQHGLSINVANDLRLFSMIKSCGIRHMDLDAIYPYPQKVELAPFFQSWCPYFTSQLKPIKNL